MGPLTARSNNTPPRAASFLAILVRQKISAFHGAASAWPIAFSGAVTIVGYMVDAFQDTGCHRGPDAHAKALCTILRKASEDWSAVNLSGATASVQGAFSALVLSGQIQLRLKVLARGLPDEPEVHAVCVVTGDYRKVLPQAIRAAVPEFSGRVAVHPETNAEYRLTRAGLATLAELNEFEDDETAPEFIAASLGFSIPGVANVHDLQIIRPVATPAKETEPEQTQEAAKRRGPPAWPLTKTEGLVSEYLKHRKDLYLRLARNVLDEASDACKKFREEFAPKVIADALTARAGKGLGIPCRGSNILKTSTYKDFIKPLMKRRPGKPRGWDKAMEDQTGEEFPPIMDEIPFAEDEWDDED